MDDGVTVEITGLAEAMRELRTLPTAIAERILRGATGTAASVIRQEAIAQAPEYTGDVSKGHPPPGTLKRAIYQARVSWKATPGAEEFIVDVRMGKFAQTTKRGKQVVNLDAYYAVWVEKGTSKMKANPFMQRAYTLKAVAAAQAFNDYVITHVDAAVLGMSYLKVVP